MLPVPAGAAEVLEADLGVEQRGSILGLGNGIIPLVKQHHPPALPGFAALIFEADGGNSGHQDSSMALFKWV